MRFSVSVLALGAACISSAVAQEIPTRRPGLWEVTINHDGRNTPPQTMQQCTDTETDKLMNAFGGDLSADLCSKQEIRKVGATIVINATCQIGPMKSTSQSVVTGDFNSNYTVKVTTKIEGVPAAAQGAGGTTRSRRVDRRLQAGSAPRRHRDGQWPDDEHPRPSQDDGRQGRSGEEKLAFG